MSFPITSEASYHYLRIAIEYDHGEYGAQVPRTRHQYVIKRATKFCESAKTGVGMSAVAESRSMLVGLPSDLDGLRNQGHGVHVR